MDDDLRPLANSRGIPSDGSPRVLIADDDKAVQTLIVAVLKRRGYDTETVRNGVEAIEKIASSDYVAILLDLMMPVADGYEVIAYLERMAPKILSENVIVLTAVSNSELRRLDGKPIFRFIRKPFDLYGLASAVSDCSRRHDLGRATAALG